VSQLASGVGFPQPEANLVAPKHRRQRLDGQKLAIGIAKIGSSLLA
jgi:hypothetical protein